MLETNRIYNTDCLAGMQAIEDKSIDMILCDLPYGVTDCRWDSVLPFDQLWQQYERIIKRQRCHRADRRSSHSQTALIQSNRKLFRYCWYWHKKLSDRFCPLQRSSLCAALRMVVFYKKPPVYHPQGLIRLDKPKYHKGSSKRNGGSLQPRTGIRLCNLEYINLPP